ncbi:aromatic ring-hydroxylating dioxygenase subunit alpha [Streptosporangium fragile]|uniref:Aromatic ring-hydroxylating dioxygenase subunit alpha n=1 Tax=Streptosporangium fragile TaxID=46186 RepID=A0ABP6IMG8_9ACTN
MVSEDRPGAGGRDGARTTAEVEEIVGELGRYLGDSPAISLPPRAYTSPEFYELERSRVFGRCWVLVGHSDELTAPGDYVALTVAGEPVVVTRGHDGALHGMSPICRHRNMPLVEPGAGRTDAFTCRYHLWRYGLDGRLLGATYMRGNKEFDPAACRLPGFAVEQWHGFVFVNLDPGAEPLAPHLGRFDRETANYRLDDMVQVASWQEEWRVNWKIAVENAHENYHVMGLHPNTVALITPRGGDMDVRVDSPWATRLRSPFTEPMEPGVLPLRDEQRAFMDNCCVFPSGSVATFADSIVWISFIPLSIDRTQVRGGVLLPPAMLDGADRDALRKEHEASSAVVNAEDRDGLEAVQRAIGSRFAGRGHLSPKEPGVLAFYRGLARALLPG